MRAETRHSLALTLGTGLTAALSITYIVYAGRVLGPAANGEFAAALSLILICWSAMAPINETVARTSATALGRGALASLIPVYRRLQTQVALGGLVFLGLGVVLIRPLTEVLGLASWEALFVGLITVYVTLFVSVGRGLLRGLQQYDRFSVSTVVEAVVRLAVGVILLHAVGGPTAALAAYAVAICAIAPHVHRQVRGCLGPSGDVVQPTASLWSFALPVLAYSLIKAGFENVDVLAAKGALAPEEAGGYAAAVALSRVMSAVATPFATLLVPLVAATSAQGRSVAPQVTRISSYFLALAAVPIGLLALGSEPIMLALYGEPFRTAAPLLLPLAVGRAAVQLAGMFCLVSLTLGRHRALAVYALSLGVEVGWLALGSPEMMRWAHGIMVAQLFSAGVVGIFMFLALRTTRQGSTGPNRSVSSSLDSPAG